MQSPLGDLSHQIFFESQDVLRSGVAPGGDKHLAPGGYRWIYAHGLCDNRQRGVALAARFTPETLVFYAVLYDGDRRRFCLSEGPSSRSEGGTRIGATRIVREGDGLLFWLDEGRNSERNALRGVVRFTFPTPPIAAEALTKNGRHRRFGLAPAARCEAFFDTPSLDFRGIGTLERYEGDEPLGAAFRRIDRFHGEDQRGSRHTLLDTIARDGTRTLHGLGGAHARAVVHTLPGTLFHGPRTLRGDRGTAPELLRNLESTPFYARALVRTSLFGSPTVGIHESLDFDALASPWGRLLTRIWPRNRS